MNDSTVVDWSLVPFPVRCARCGADVFGQSEPECTSCGLTFAWRDAVPIAELECGKCRYPLIGLRGTRCPECGTDFTWEDALERHYQKRKPIFEYRYRSDPIRSFLASWRLAMAPGRLWRLIDIYDPPRVKPLWFTAVFGMAFTLLFGVMSEGLSRWALVRVVGGTGAPSRWQLPQYLGSALLHLPNYRAPLLAFIWMAALFGALLLFQQSMRRSKVRTIHVFRVWVYAAAYVVPIIPLFLYAASVIATRGGFFYYDTWLPIVGGFILFVTWSIRQGYCHYLRIPHSVWIALTAQAVALLAAFVIRVQLRLVF